MKVNNLFFTLLLLFLTGCGTDSTSKASSDSHNSDDLFGARFKEGKGVELSDITRASLHLETAEVIEKEIGNRSPVTAIPSPSLLRTAAGTFVYVVNGRHFLRTEVKTGRSSENFIEVTDGLYPGDEVVKTPVNLLWYAELQAIRGGQSCADEH